MNEWLAQYFGTAPVGEETEKQASAELFVKLAMENGIDLNAMTDSEVQELYESTMGKMAEEEPKKEEDEKKKKVEEAAAEHEAKKESQAKFAEAVFMGQTMAHAFTAELDKIALAKEAADKEPGRGLMLHPTEAKVRGTTETIGRDVKPGQVATQGLGVKHRAKIKAHELAAKLRGKADKVVELAKAHPGRAAAIGAGALAAGGAAAYGIHKATEKKSSALDDLAAERAVEKVASAGWDVNEAVERISAVVTLGVDDENSKVAFAQTLEDAVEVRSLEIAEAAGYPINWPTE